MLSYRVVLSPKKAYVHLYWIFQNIREVVILILCVSQYDYIWVLCICYLISIYVGKKTCMLNHILSLRFLSLCNFLQASWPHLWCTCATWCLWCLWGFVDTSKMNPRPKPNQHKVIQQLRHNLMLKPNYVWHWIKIVNMNMKKVATTMMGDLITSINVLF